jgi:hypothetical protein
MNHSRSHRPCIGLGWNGEATSGAVVPANLWLVRRDIFLALLSLTYRLELSLDSVTPIFTSYGQALRRCAAPRSVVCG